MSLAQSVRLVQSQRLVQEQRIFLGHAMLGAPILAIDKTIEAVLSNPSIVEGNLKTEKGHGGSHPLLYISAVKNISEGIAATNIGVVQSRRATGGKLHFGDVLEAKIDDKTMALPDVTYHVRGYGDFSILPAEHFQPSKLELKLYQLTTEVKQFVMWLNSQRNWIVKTLEECYLQIGKRQAGFLLKLDPSELVPLPLSNIDYLQELPHHPSTYYRLLKNRSVGIDSPSGKSTLPVFYLLPNINQVVLYSILPNLNDMLRNEFESGIALSDEKVSKKIGKISRRAITKYRILVGIPSSAERQKLYDRGVEEPFRICTSIEPYLLRKNTS